MLDLTLPLSQVPRDPVPLGTHPRLSSVLKQRAHERSLPRGSVTVAESPQGAVTSHNSQRPKCRVNKIGKPPSS